MENIKGKENALQKPSLFGILKPYTKLVVLLIVLALISNALTLWVPLIISHGIDGFIRGGSIQSGIIVQFSLASAFIFIFAYLQSIVQTYASEKVARDMRHDLSEKISTKSFLNVQQITPAKLLTNLTADVDSIKSFVAQAIANIISSLFIIIGTGVLLISLNWKLGLSVFVIVPIIGGTFYFVLTRVRKLFFKSREIIDSLNKVINESILGSALVRVLNSHSIEFKKFGSANADARDLGLKILKLFSSMIPVISFSANLGILIILILGGHFVITGGMSLGEFAAFNTYLTILIFPIFIIGFMSNIIAQAQASYDRIAVVLNAPVEPKSGVLKNDLVGEIEFKNITLSYGEKHALNNVSLAIKSGTKTAILGPTAAGKTQLLYLLVGLIKPSSGKIVYDGKDLESYDPENLHSQLGFVFQDSIIFNMSLKENIAFNTQVKESDLQKAIETSELKDFISALPEGLNTIVSERGTNLSGGQKQRIMLARALSLNPKILLLDDFTARVDSQTERKILENISKNYPGITLVSVTQKIASVEHYNKIVVLMEGEIVAEGLHETLLETSPEYVQIYNSQQSTSTYELRPE